MSKLCKQNERHFYAIFVGQKTHAGEALHPVTPVCVKNPSIESIMTKRQWAAGESNPLRLRTL